jgi:hypothetical protein
MSPMFGKIMVSLDRVLEMGPAPGHGPELRFWPDHLLVPSGWVEVIPNPGPSEPPRQEPIQYEHPEDEILVRAEDLERECEANANRLAHEAHCKDLSFELKQKLEVAVHTGAAVDTQEALTIACELYKLLPGGE